MFGIDLIDDNPWSQKQLGNVAVLANQAATDSNLTPTITKIFEWLEKNKNGKLVSVFGPQHGYFQTEQYNMIETPDLFYILPNLSKVPLFSLYSERRIPTLDQLKNVDTIIVDLIDIGCRVYTYMLSLAAILKSTHNTNIQVIVLDRPNPLNLNASSNAQKRIIEGNLLDLQWYSFVGWYSMPMRHGLTLGELGNFFIEKDKLKTNYHVIPHGFSKLSTKHINHWNPPSPNIPTLASAFMFPAFVSLEGTNMSEGRGTTTPFQIIGAPWFDSKAYLAFLKKYELLFEKESLGWSSLKMREHVYRPTFDKYKEKICEGVYFYPDLHTNYHSFSLCLMTLAFLVVHHPESFEWREPGYEYNYKDPPINLILGSSHWKEYIEKLKCEAFNPQDLINLIHASQEEANQFIHQFKRTLIYE